MTAQPVDHTHPVVACLDTIEAALDAVAEVNPTFMRTAEKAAALTQLARVQARISALGLDVMAAAEDVAEQTAARDIGAWLAAETRTDHQPAHADAKLAWALDRRWQRVAAGMRAGEVSLAQARVITGALDRVVDEALPRVEGLSVDKRTELVALAETTLVDEARRLKPKELRTVGKRILETIAPDLFEEAEARRLAEEEDRAWRRTSLRFQPTGDGTTKIFARLPDASAVRLRTYLEAYTAPRNRRDEPRRAGEAHRIPGDRKLGQAFCALLEHLDPAKLPQHGGDATTLMVTIPLETLQTGLGYGELLDGTPLSPGEARRLACTSRIIPAVLGGNSEILDLGRADRLFRPAQRKAIRLRDRRCRAKGCDIRAEWTEVHHLTPWRDGGPTDLANGISLCFYHHRRADHPRYDTAYNPTTHELEITRKPRR